MSPRTFTYSILLSAILVASTAFATVRPSMLSAADSGISSGSGFSFGAAGDHNASVTTRNSLARLANASTSFYLALGDLSYQNVGQEYAWCALVHSYLGPNYPFEILAGNHDQSHIDYYLSCLPDKIGNISGDYGKQYYFDYPPGSPLARFILISPNLLVTTNGQNVNQTFSKGSVEYNWLSNTIDSARSQGIPWVIVGMHEVCISTGVMKCQVGTDLMNLLFQKKVDLVLQAHDHNYQRSKQLTCATPGLFVPSCVANDGSNGTYTQGAGTVIVIDGTFGASEACCRISSSQANSGYFATWMGLNTPGNGYGFVKYQVSSQSISAQTMFNGTYADSFTIVGRPGTVSRGPIVPPNTDLPSILLGASLVGIIGTVGLLYHRRKRNNVIPSAAQS